MLSTERKGTIISQDPAAGTEVDKGSVVTFKVSIGVETVQIPDISNKYYEIAIDELYDLGILYKTKYIASDTVKENYVVKTDPAAFKEIKSDTTITVYISSGKDVVTVTVPDVKGRTEADAVSKLASSSLQADKIYEYNDTVPKNCVISQNPAPDTKLDEGDTVEIKISLGPKEEEKPDTDKPDDKDPDVPTDTKPDDKPDDDPDDKDDPDGEDDPTDPTKVDFSITADLTAFSAKSTVSLTISSSDNSWNKVQSVNISDIASKEYKYTSETVSLAKGTTVSLFVDGTLFKTYTVN